MQSPLVSVIIPCYNQGKYISDALASIYKQTYLNIEVIVVDDGSTDNETSNILAAINNPIVKVFTTINQGLADTRNFGIKKSSGKYILPLDADDYIDENYIESAVSILEEKLDIGLVYGRAIFFGEKHGEWLLEPFELDKMLFSNLIYASAIYRRKDYGRTEGYDNKMLFGWEDWEFWLSLLEQKVNVFFINEICFHYRINKNSMVRKMSDHQKSYLLQRIYCNHAALYVNHFKDPINLFYDYKYYKSEHDRLLSNRLIKLINFISKKLVAKK